MRWFATPRRTELREVVLGEEGLERLGERRRVGDLTVAQDAGPQLGVRAALDGDVAVHADLGGRDVAGVEIEPDDRLVLVLVFRLSTRLVSAGRLAA